MKFENRSVLVTGANRGLGQALVYALLRAGVRTVHAAARDPKRLGDFGDDRVQPLRLDINEEAHIHHAVEVAGDIDLLINNAGIAAFTSLLGNQPELFARDMKTNYHGTLNLTRAFLPVLETKTDPAIVNVVSTAAFVNFPMIGGYSASKAALFSASQGMRIELAPRGVRVHTVNPGPIDTDMIKDMDGEKTDPRVVAENIISALRSGDLDIFPDPASQRMFSLWRGDYRDLEEMVSKMVHGAG